VTNRPTDHAIPSVTTGLIYMYVRSIAMRSNKFNTWYIRNSRFDIPTMK